MRATLRNLEMLVGPLTIKPSLPSCEELWRFVDGTMSRCRCSLDFLPQPVPSSRQFHRYLANESVMSAAASRGGW